MDILIKATQLILGLSILVFIHELGHYLFAKLFKIRVEKFYIFFNPWFSLYKFTFKGTEYGIGWLPLGGYVKIGGMIDESMDKEQLKAGPREDDFMSKPRWQRLLVMFGGVLFNIILGVIIYIGLTFCYGSSYISNNDLKYGVTASKIAQEVGLQSGDIIKSVDGVVFEKFGDIHPAIVLADKREIVVLRDGKELKVSVADSILPKLLTSRDFISVRLPMVALAFDSTKGAFKSGLRARDSLVAFNGKVLRFADEYLDSISYYKGKEIVLTAIRNGNETLEFKTQVDTNGKIGMAFYQVDHYGMIKTEHYGFLESIPEGTSKTISALGSYVKQLKLIVMPESEAYKSLGGFISIGNLFPPVWDWQIFWSISAFLSIVLAVMNILPIPGLDGGHILFTITEMIIRRPLSIKFLEIAQWCGMILLFALLLFANANDVIKLF